MILKLFAKKHPRERGIYAVLKGTYSGEYIVFLRRVSSILNFIAFPDKKILQVPEKDFREGLEGKFIDFIQSLPKDVYSVVEEEAKRLNKVDGLRTAKKDNKPHKRSMGRAKNNNSRSREQNHKRSSLD